jgi:hypothetical protein
MCKALGSIFSTKRERDGKEGGERRRVGERRQEKERRERKRRDTFCSCKCRF